MTQCRRSQGIGLLLTAVFSAVLLWALAAVIWPVPVVYADEPEIITITVTSSLETYFYDPGLDPTGGTVYFNSVGGEGAGQVLTVTVTCSGTVSTFEGAPAFDDTPPPNTSSPWEITYTVEMSMGTQSGIVFTVTNAMSQTDTAVITFTQDNVDPGLPASPQARPDGYADTGEYDDDTEIYFTWNAASDNPDGSGIATYYAEIGDPIPDEDAGTDGQDTDTGSEGLNAYYVAAIDHVGNVGSAVSDTITIDLTPPSITGITVTSESPTYFYDPGLTVTGGEVFFNSLAGEGGGQTITVTVSWTDDNPYRLQGDDAFNDGPQADTSGPPWTVSYSIENDAPSETNRVFTVTDQVGHTDTAIINFTRDNVDPTVELTDVTDPGYDNDPDRLPPESTDELDADGSNWYNAGDFIGVTYRWYFTSTTSDGGAGLASGSAFWDHTDGITYDQTKNCGSDGSDFFSGVGDDDDGVVTVTVTITDRVGNSSSDLVVFNIDNTPPALRLPSIEEYDSPYLHVPGSTVIYYGDSMGTVPTPFTVKGEAKQEDDGVGLDKATYPTVFGTTPDPTDLKGAGSGWHEWFGTYTVRGTNCCDGTIQVTVSDLLGNSATQLFAYFRDVTHPEVEITNVTDPDYDPVGGELDDEGNWYRTGGLTAGWAFTSDTDDNGAGLGSGTAFWDHSSGTIYDQTTNCGSDGDGTFTGVSDDGDGTVTVTVTITDKVGNAANDMLVIRLDGTAPSVPDNFAYQNDTDSGSDGIDPLSGYYDDTVIDLEWDASTDGSGSGLPTPPYYLGTAPQPTGGPYPEDSSYTVSSNGTYIIYLTAKDNVGNISDDTVIGPVVVDTQDPQVDIDCPPGTAEFSFVVDWSATADPGPAGLRSTDPYSVSYSIDGGGWQNWIAATSAVTATFGPNSPVTVEYGHTYCFHVRAVDRAGNVQYTNGDDCTEVSEIYAPPMEKVFLPIIMAPDPNWGFELGNFTNWQHGGQLAQSVQAAPYSGSYSALLGSTSYACNGVPVGSAWLRRSVTVPSSGSPTLSFWYRIYSQDKNTGLTDDYDLFVVYINGSVEVVRDANTSDPYGCSSLRDLGWKQVVFPLSTPNDYRGQTIQITFYNYNRAPTGAQWYNTYTYVDDVTVQ